MLFLVVTIDERDEAKGFDDDTYEREWKRQVFMVGSSSLKLVEDRKINNTERGKWKVKGIRGDNWKTKLRAD